ncbi:dTDP-4-dehydrorhamnose reductase [Mesorhizobium sp. NBSH29]|uniref:dTDP-4-dehydrorhamnose reductase n=1 Tax=Mesorhizobium sp. NBSH29 TaxID=2654249 RepID=UPI001896907B|nr:dTDP-4-dehydrorhamnose reductase [Mesorhizobium sp. NBSH29]QPC88578.1 dTDP-4-dehydrorhamnose reductase [Mesorhizobium sp. NBSH29]
MRILVAGQCGQVATALSKLTASDIAIVCAGRPELDIRDLTTIRQAISREKPDVLVNAAAYTAVDKAETDIDTAFAINADGAGNVAKAAFEAGLPVIHISTDYVFPGDNSSPYVETDPVAPTGVYGRSKLAGEAAVLAANAHSAILRTAWVYSPWGGNFLKTMLRLAETRDAVNVVADQYGNPTYAPDIAEGIVAAVQGLLADADGTRGVFHMTALGEATWADFAEAIFTASREFGGPSADVGRITTAEYSTPAQRPANSRLDSTLFRQTFGYTLPDWRERVPACIAALMV